MKQQRLSYLFSELQKSLKWIVSAAVVLGGGIIPFYQILIGWVGSGPLIIIFALGILNIVSIMLLWKLSGQTHSEAWYDREYKLVNVLWKYVLSKDARTLDGECISERKVVCLEGEISHIQITVDKDESLIPFDPSQDYNLQLITGNRERGQIELRGPHRKEGTSFAFRVVFHPPLIKGETAHVKMKFKLPCFKISNIEDLREKMINAIIDARDYEYNSFTINFPIEEFHYEVFMPKQCNASPLGLEVTRGTSTFIDEKNIVMNKNFFRVIEEDAGWRMILDRKRPPIKAKYLFQWKPAKLKNISCNEKITTYQDGDRQQ